MKNTVTGTNWYSSYILSFTILREDSVTDPDTFILLVAIHWFSKNFFPSPISYSIFRQSNIQQTLLDVANSIWNTCLQEIGFAERHSWNNLFLDLMCVLNVFTPFAVLRIFKLPTSITTSIIMIGNCDHNL